MQCKRCLRPYVHPFKVNISFPFCEQTIEWEGCADCAYHIKRQLADFMLKAAMPTKKVQRKLDRSKLDRKGFYDKGRAETKTTGQATMD